MKSLVKLLLVLVLFNSGVAWSKSPNISSWKTNYKVDTNVWIKLDNKPGNAKDWIGIYKAGTDNYWKNIVAWKWAKSSNKWFKFTDLARGSYEARFFLNGSDITNDKAAFSVGTVSTVKISSQRKHYKANSNVWIKLDNKPGNAKDWIGIYRAGTDNYWKNIVAWRWAKSSEKWFKFVDLEGGSYEARFFLNGSDITAAKVAFSVGTGTSSILKLSKTIFAPNEKVSGYVSGYLSGDADWIGVFHKGQSSQDWDNMIAWNEITEEGYFILNKKNEEMPAGEYEARLFFHDSCKVIEAKVPFTVKD